MAKKNIIWKTQGMNRDTSVSAFNPKFAFENINLRLSTNEGNTALSWVNERGTQEMTLKINKGFVSINSDSDNVDHIIGTSIGTAILNHQLVLFSCDAEDKNPSNCYIYVLAVSAADRNILEGKVLFKGNLGFDLKHPLETLVSYEAENIQKVYWTDGKNQPRVINIAADEKTIKKWNQMGNSIPFDFVPELQLTESVEITKLFGAGEFPAGVIQYAFTYYNRHGQESNIFHTTPLQYISYKDRGGSPDSKIANSFRIGITGIDHHFDYIRIYSLLRTSKDATPLVKRVVDLPIPASSDDTEAKGNTFDSFKSNLDNFGNTLRLSLIKQINYADNNFYIQGAAAYGKYLFQAYIAGKYIDVVDLTSHERIATLVTDIPFRTDEGSNSYENYHGNVLSFGKDKVEGSDFPYLYYSCENNTTPCILVFKIIQKDGIWEGKKANIIYLPESDGGKYQGRSDGGVLGFSHYYQNGCVDAENHCIWVSGYTMNSYQQNTGSYEGNQLVYRKYELPMTFTEDVLLSASEVLDAFTLDFKKGTQGMVIQDNKLYQCFGYDSKDIYDEFLDCIDLVEKKITKSYQFPKEQLEETGSELESPYIYDGNLYLSATANNAKYYTLWNLAFASNGGAGEVIVGPAIESKYELSYIDDGLHGDTIDPTELLYKGGEEMTANTMEQKDSTLFFGNLRTERPMLDQLQEELFEADGNYESLDTYPLSQGSIESALSKRYFTLANRYPLSYINTFSCPNGLGDKDDEYELEEITSEAGKSYKGALGFKAREYYRLGIQLQYKTGKWSEPCWIGDIRQSMVPRVEQVTADSKVGIIYVPEFKYTIGNSVKEGKELLERLWDMGYRKIRPLFAVPQSSSDKTILCQGVGCPTMFRKADRGNSKTRGHLYAQSSWLFRVPNAIEDTSHYGDADNGGGYVSYKGRLKSQYDVDVIGPVSGDPTSDDYPVTMSPYLRSTEIMGTFDEDHAFCIDPYFATIHSPELIFDESFSNMDFTGCELYKIGNVELSQTFSDISIQTSTPAIGSDSAGFVHRSIITNGSAALITAPFYNDHLVDDYDDKYGSYQDGSSIPVDFPVYMWHKNGSLNNDVNRSNRSAELLKKKISNYRFSNSVDFYNNDYISDFKKYDVEDIQLFNSDVLSMVKVNGHPYEGNIETMLTPTDPSPYYFFGHPWRSYEDDMGDNGNHRGRINFDTADAYYMLKCKDPKISDSLNGFWEWWKDGTWKWHHVSNEVGDNVRGLDQWREPISMKYKSTPHLAVSLKDIDASPSIYQDSIENCLPLMEVVKPYNNNTFFGGMGRDALEAITWIPCGPAVSFRKTDQSKVVRFKWGDTYIQRFECLKTYPFTQEDKNQVIEIASYMCETRVNIDGRYDRNRAQASNLNMTPQNFNLLNPVYSQMDNFFSYKMLSEDSYKINTYPNNITWTKTKENSADVDLWTHVTMANALELDGDKGKVTQLIRLNNQLLAFQDKGISQILYNENTQISTTEGVPIEIANSQKVQGKRYYSDTVGCSNKWSMIQTPMGIYFMDSNERSIYLFNGQLNNLSTAGGFNSWAKQNIPSAGEGWEPESFKDFVTHYDKMNQEVLFVNEHTALAYSEKFGCFTSFYDYGKAPYFCNLDDMGIWIKNNKLWRHQAGSYCHFFGDDKPFSMTLIANQEPQTDKLFTNMEFRACIEGDGSENNGKFTPLLPFDSLEAWDEYQHGLLALKNRAKAGGKMERITHGDLDGILNRKFRIWRCDIPRDNAPLDTVREKAMGISRLHVKPLDRMRNPWIYLKLQKNAAAEGSHLNKTEIHDIMVSYFD